MSQGGHSEPLLLLALFYQGTPSCLKVMGWGGGGGGPCDFGVSPSPFALDFGTLDFGTSDSGLTIVCSGRGHEFFYNSSAFYEMKIIGSKDWSLAGTNLFHIVVFLSFCSSIVVTPVCYAAIYRY